MALTHLDSRILNDPSIFLSNIINLTIPTPEYLVDDRIAGHNEWMFRSLGITLRSKFIASVNCTREIDVDLQRFMDSYSLDEKKMLKIDQKAWANVVDEWEAEPRNKKLPFIGSIIHSHSESTYRRYVNGTQIAPAEKFDLDLVVSALQLQDRQLYQEELRRVESGLGGDITYEEANSYFDNVDSSLDSNYFTWNQYAEGLMKSQTTLARSSSDKVTAPTSCPSSSLNPTPLQLKEIAFQKARVLDAISELRVWSVLRAKHDYSSEEHLHKEKGDKPERKPYGTNRIILATATFAHRFQMRRLDLALYCLECYQVDVSIFKSMIKKADNTTKIFWSSESYKPDNDSITSSSLINVDIDTGALSTEEINAMIERLRIAWSVTYTEKKRCAEERSLVMVEMDRTLRWLNSKLNDCSTLSDMLPEDLSFEIETSLDAIISNRRDVIITLRNDFLSSWISACTDKDITPPITWTRWSAPPRIRRCKASHQRSKFMKEGDLCGALSES
ncbi:hypothetical protein SCHPADRAFT_948112 [Schizopora paradoxa]|uniref:Uncharacterized protein n=1 Tax=Schizopora paradoxa TaxID=27342 RepID=A0A0H2QXC1_9AGAM|nr:hypothetical protein SCHPADRAFT_948112 [Schizopora paradoxa]